MEYARLGNTGMTVSRICLGCMSYGGGPQLGGTASGEAGEEREWDNGVSHEGYKQ